MIVQIAEIYRSVQGEGFLTGTDSVFVRASGCNLRCWFCDTPYTSWNPEGQDLTIDEILAECEEWDARHVVLTGGEPMLFAELIPLAEQLSAGRLSGGGRHITIETAGTLYLPVRCDLMSISPKLANSTPSAERDARWRRRHERTRHAPDVIRRLIAENAYQFKFVVDSPEDATEVLRYLDEFPEIDRARAMLMPQGVDAATLASREAWLVGFCTANGLVYCPRRHIEWFGLVRGT
ncbi:MAG: 7-carboxy-7-deazaguanine synthase QueE [Pirellulales bacterium]